MAVTLDTEDRIDRAMQAMAGLVELMAIVRPEEVIAVGNLASIFGVLNDEIRAAMPKAWNVRGMNDEE